MNDLFTYAEERDIAAKKHRGNAESAKAYERASKGFPEARRKVYEAVIEAGASGITCKELAEKWGVGMHKVSGRFSELKERGFIRKSGTRDGSAVMTANEAI